MPQSPKYIQPSWIKNAKKEFEKSKPREQKVYDLAKWKKYRQRYMATKAKGVCEVDLYLNKTTDVTGKRAGALDHIVRIEAGGSVWDERNHMMMKKYWHDKKRNLEAKKSILVETIEIEDEYGNKELIPKNRFEIIKVLSGE